MENNNKTYLTLNILRSYGFKERIYKPTEQETCIEFELPNGLLLSTLTESFGYSTESDCLEGLSGWIYIETKEELDKLVKQKYTTILNEISKKNSKFDKNKFIHNNNG